MVTIRIMMKEKGLFQKAKNNNLAVVFVKLFESTQESYMIFESIRERNVKVVFSNEVI